MKERVVGLGVALVVVLLAFGLLACEPPAGPGNGDDNEKTDELPEEVILAAGGTFHVVDTVMENMPEGTPSEGDTVYDQDGITATVDSMTVETVDGTDYMEGTISAVVEDFAFQDPSGTEVTANGEFTLEATGIDGESPSEMTISADMEFTADERTINATLSATVVGAGDGEGPGEVTGSLTVNGVVYDLAEIIEQIEEDAGGDTDTYSLTLDLERPEHSPDGGHRFWVEFYSDSGRTDLLRREGPGWLGSVNGEGNYGDAHTVTDIPSGEYYLTVYVTINAPDEFAPAYAYELPGSVNFDRDKNISVAAGQWHAPQLPDDLLAAAGGMFHIIGAVVESATEENLADGYWELEQGNIYVDYVDDNDPAEEAVLSIDTISYAFDNYDPDEAVDGMLNTALSFQGGELVSVNVSGYVIFRFSDASEVHAGIDGTLTDITGEGPQTGIGTFEFGSVHQDPQPAFALAHIVDQIDF